MRATRQTVMIGWALLMLAACGDDGDRITGGSSGWSIGAPETRSTDETFTIPRTGSINYVTRPSGSLAGKKRITLRYRIEMAEGVQIIPASVAEQLSIITLYFQRQGDDWSGGGEKNLFRWYATSKFQSPIVAGEHVLTASLADDIWTAVNDGNSAAQASYFALAMRDASRVGFVLGGGTGFGHGVRATGPATFTIVDFRVD